MFGVSVTEGAARATRTGSTATAKANTNTAKSRQSWHRYRDAPTAHERSQREEQPLSGERTEQCSSAVAFVEDVADQLLEEIFEGHQTGGGAVRFDHEGEMDPGLAHRNQEVFE